MQVFKIKKLGHYQRFEAQKRKSLQNKNQYVTHKSEDE